MALAVVCLLVDNYVARALPGSVGVVGMTVCLGPVCHVGLVCMMSVGLGSLCWLLHCYNIHRTYLVLWMF